MLVFMMIGKFHLTASIEIRLLISTPLGFLGFMFPFDINVGMHPIVTDLDPGAFDGGVTSCLLHGGMTVGLLAVSKNCPAGCVQICRHGGPEHVVLVLAPVASDDGVTGCLLHGSVAVGQFSAVSVVGWMGVSRSMGHGGPELGVIGCGPGVSKGVVTVCLLHAGMAVGQLSAI